MIRLTLEPRAKPLVLTSIDHDFRTTEFVLLCAGSAELTDALLDIVVSVAAGVADDDDDDDETVAAAMAAAAASTRWLRSSSSLGPRPLSAYEQALSSSTSP